MFQPKRILHPTDFSASSQAAYQVAVGLAHHHQATVFVLHVVETLGAENVTYGEAGSHLQPEGYLRRLQDDLKRAVPAPEGVDVRYLFAEGDPAEQIDRIAVEQSCDLIVMGDHDRSVFEYVFSGSTAEAASRGAPCPVLMLKLPQQRKA